MFRTSVPANESSRELTGLPEGWRLGPEAAWEAAVSRLQSNMIESVLSNCVKQIKARAKGPGR